jgi:glycine hydroxymethyltransferase
MPIQPTPLQANMAVYFTVRKPGTDSGLGLSHGGHLTHGHRSIFRHFYHVEAYEVDKTTEQIDYDHLMKQAVPPSRMIVAGRIGLSTHLDFAKFREAADCANLMVDMAHIAGLIAAVCIRHRFRMLTS